MLLWIKWTASIRNLVQSIAVIIITSTKLLKKFRQKVILKRNFFTTSTVFILYAFCSWTCNLLKGAIHKGRSLKLVIFRPSPPLYSGDRNSHATPTPSPLTPSDVHAKEILWLPRVCIQRVVTLKTNLLGMTNFFYRTFLLHYRFSNKIKQDKVYNGPRGILLNEK